MLKSLKINSHLVAAIFAATLLGGQIVVTQADVPPAPTLPACSGTGSNLSSYTYGCLPITGQKCYDSYIDYYDAFNYKFQRAYAYTQFSNGIRVRANGTITKISPEQCCTTNAAPPLVKSTCK